MPTHPLASSLAPTPSLSCPPSISPQLSPLCTLTLLLAPSPVWRSGGVCSGVGRAMGCWRTWGCQCGRACSVTVRLTGVQGWGVQSRGRGGRCWVQRGRVTAGGACETALVGCCIVARPVRWRPSRGGGLCGAVGVQDMADTSALCTVATWWPRQGRALQWRRQLARELPMGKSPGNHSKISKVEKKRKKKKEKTHRLPARTQQRAYP